MCNTKHAKNEGDWTFYEIFKMSKSLFCFIWNELSPLIFLSHLFMIIKIHAYSYFTHKGNWNNCCCFHCLDNHIYNGNIGPVHKPHNILSMTKTVL